MKTFSQHLRENRAPRIRIGNRHFDPGKKDPTQYDAATHTIDVRPGYDTADDPAGWMVHERVHASRRDTPDPEDSPYPEGPTERAAFSAQLRYLKDRGHTFDEIFEIPTMEHLRDHDAVLRRYWPR